MTTSYASYMETFTCKDCGASGPLECGDQTPRFRVGDYVRLLVYEPCQAAIWRRFRDRFAASLREEGMRYQTPGQSHPWAPSPAIDFEPVRVRATETRVIDGDLCALIDVGDGFINQSGYVLAPGFGRLPQPERGEIE